MDRNLLVISVNDGRRSGSGDQHSSISFLHSGSQRSGIVGLSVFFTIPPSVAGYHMRHYTPKFQNKFDLRKEVSALIRNVEGKEQEAN